MKKLLLTAGLFAVGMTSAFSQSTIWSPRNMNADTTYGVRWMDAVDSNTIWALPYDGTIPTRASNLFVKTGNGTTFTRGTFLPDTNDYNSSNICALDSMTAFIALYDKAADGTSGKILKTTDGGATWMNASDSMTMFTGVNNFPNFVYFWNSNNGICMGDPNGNTSGQTIDEFEIYRTNNGGTSWTRVPDANLPNPTNSEYGLTNCYFAMGKRVWFGTNKGRVYSSLDSGQTWTVGAATGFAGGVQGLAFRDSLHGMAWGLATISATTNTLKKTNDGGATWSAVTLDPNNTGIYDFCVIPGRNAYMSVGVNSGNTGYVTSVTPDDGASWTALESGTTAGFRMLRVEMLDSMHGWASNFSDDTITVANPNGKGGLNVYRGPSIALACPINIIASKTAMCLNDSITLTASGATTYTWSTTQNNATIVVYPTTSTVYTVNGAYGTCTNTQTVSITVTQVATPTVTMSSLSDTVCAGSQLLLQGVGATTYTWSPSTGLSASTGANVFGYPTTTTSYTLTGANGTCKGTTTFTLHTDPTPGPTVTVASATLCTSNTSTVSLVANGATSYTWTPASTLNTNIGDSVVASPTVTTTYYVTGETGYCMSAKSVTVTVISNCASGISQVTGANKLAVYPNPSNGMVTISIPSLIGTTSMQVTDMIGKEVYRYELKANDTTIDLSTLQRGLYMITLNDGKSVQTTKLVINN